MKKLASTVLFSLFLMITASFAQPEGGGQRMDPEKRAAQQTEMMKERLSLSEAQTAKVQEVNLSFALKMKEMREKMADSDDREAMRASMKTLRDEQNAALKTFLTEEQWAEWDKISKEREKRGFGPGRGGNNR